MRHHMFSQRQRQLQPAQTILAENAAQRADSTAKFNQLATMMSQMASMINTSQDSVRGEIKAAIAASSKDVSIVATQVASMVSSIKVLEEQINTNADFSTDAFIQTREEFRGEMEALRQSVNERASNAGGLMPCSSADTPTPTVNNERKPHSESR